jgi:replicative DNA helicase
MIPQEWHEEKVSRHLLAAALIKFGIPYLDDALIGILPNDLIVVGARTGRGKTELATTIAYTASSQHRRVLFFALEADQWEIQRRMKYRKLAQFFQAHYATMASEGFKFPRYREWLTQGASAEWEALEKEAEKEISRDTGDLKIVYKGESYTAQRFVADMNSVAQEYDLVIVDHLHYFDHDTANEYQGIKEAIHAIRNSAIYHGKPVILLAHLRKSDRGSMKSLPELDDFHGHSDIVKVATTVLLLSPVPPDKLPGDVGTYPTYFHIAKARTASEVTPFVAVCGFDQKNNSYSPRYYLERAQFSKDPEPLQYFEIPKWAKNALPGMPTTVMGG